MAGRGKTVPGDMRSMGSKRVPGIKSVPGGQTVWTVVNTIGQKEISPTEVKQGPGGKTIPTKNLTTKRQRKLANVMNPGANDNEKGKVQGEGDDLEWKNECGEVVEWIPAVYHNDIREKLLAKASNDGQLVYDHPRKHGHLPFDETAFLASQQHWGQDRSLWHHIPGDLLNRMDRLNHKGRDYETSDMFDEDTDRIVLDMDNHPVVDYQDIPLVLSSQFASGDEGWLMEAIQRIDLRIELGDFRARMPWKVMSKVDGPVVPLFTMSSIGNRSCRWRQNNAIVSWTQRNGSKELREYIIALLSEEGRRQNSTRELVNGLTKEQRLEAQKPNKGRMLSKAGRRRLRDDVRDSRVNKSMKTGKFPSTKQISKKRSAPEDFDDNCEITGAQDSRSVQAGTSYSNARNDSNQSLTAFLALPKAESTLSSQAASSGLRLGGHSSHDTSSIKWEHLEGSARRNPYLKSDEFAKINPNRKLLRDSPKASISNIQSNFSSLQTPPSALSNYANFIGFWDPRFAHLVGSPLVATANPMPPLFPFRHQCSEEDEIDTGSDLDADTQI